MVIVLDKLVCITAFLELMFSGLLGTLMLIILRDFLSEHHHHLSFFFFYYCTNLPPSCSLLHFSFHFFLQWATVTFHLPHHVLKLVASAIVNELKKINQNVAALSVASSIMDRLSYLLSSARPELGVGPGRSVDR